MKKIKSTKQLKIEYEKVFENPLDWCPLFGYLPEVEEYDACDDRDVLELIEACLDIIHICRENFGFDYRPAWHMKKYVCVPDIELILPHADNDYNDYIQALRNLFRNLDFLLLRTASLCNNPPMLARDIGWTHKTIKIETEFPEKLIGRVSNRYNNASSTIAQEMRLDRVFWLNSILLDEAIKFSGDAAKLDSIKLVSLCAILEAWLVVTRLLLLKHNKEDLLFYMGRLSYARELINIADHLNNNQYLSGVYIENMTLTDENKGLKDEIEEIEEIALPLIKEKKEQKKRGKALGYIRQRLMGIQMAVMHFKEKSKTERRSPFNDRKLYEHIFENYCVDDDLIDELCKGVDVDNKFFVCGDESNPYYVFMLPDEEKPEDPLAAYLCQIQEADRDKMRKTMKTIKYKSYRSEYFYKRNTDRKRGKVK